LVWEGPNAIAGPLDADALEPDLGRGRVDDCFRELIATRMVGFSDVMGSWKTALTIVRRSPRVTEAGAPTTSVSPRRTEPDTSGWLSCGRSP
jgi:hypothetical protein